MPPTSAAHLHTVHNAPNPDGITRCSSQRARPTPTPAHRPPQRLALPGRLDLSFSTRCRAIAASQLGTAASYACLVLTDMPPLLPMATLGACWAVSHTVVWGSFPALVPPGLLALGAGLTGTAINVGPALLPLAFSYLARGAVSDAAADQTSILLLVSAALAGAACFFALPLSTPCPTACRAMASNGVPPRRPSSRFAPDSACLRPPPPSRSAEQPLPRAAAYTEL